MLQQKEFNGDFINQEDFNTTPIFSDTEKHLACIFVLDTSGSMTLHSAIDQLNMGLKIFKEQTIRDNSTMAQACIDIALISFDSEVKVIQDFTPISQMITPNLEAYGQTKMGEALDTAMDMITRRKKAYVASGTPYFRPWLFCITDGQPTDGYKEAAERLQWMEENRKLVSYCIGVEGCNYSVMQEIFDPNSIFGLKDCDFVGLFKFVSASITPVINSKEGTPAVNVDVPSSMFHIPLN